jgi:hypothetical protein
MNRIDTSGVYEHPLDYSTLAFCYAVMFSGSFEFHRGSKSIEVPGLPPVATEVIGAVDIQSCRA